jgi:hypothetical protein
MDDADKVELVEIKTARNAIEAELIVSILEAAGIPTMLDSRYLQDEFAVPRKMISGEGTAVYVRKEQEEDARRVLAEARAAGEALTEDE